MKCRVCGKVIGADSSISMSGRAMCLPCGIKTLEDAGVDVAWLGLKEGHRRRRPHHGQTSIAMFGQSYQSFL